MLPPLLDALDAAGSSPAGVGPADSPVRLVQHLASALAELRHVMQAELLTAQQAGQLSSAVRGFLRCAAAGEPEQQHQEQATLPGALRAVLGLYQQQELPLLDADAAEVRRAVLLRGKPAARLA